MKNRARLACTALYDLLLKMQDELELCRQHRESPCIMNALGENLVGVRCTKYNGKCDECLQKWLNEEEKQNGKAD